MFSFRVSTAPMMVEIGALNSCDSKLSRALKNAVPDTGRISKIIARFGLKLSGDQMFSAIFRNFAGFLSLQQIS